MKHLSKTASERLFFLGKYTAGEAKESISGFLSMFTDDVYVRAKMMLMTRYGDKVQIAAAYRIKLLSWPVIRKDDGKALQKFSDFLWQCHTAMDTVGNLDSLNAADENRKIARKIPACLYERWIRVVDRWMYQAPPDNTLYALTPAGIFPPFVEFCRFIASEARILNGPCKELSTAIQPEKSAEANHQDRSKRIGRKNQSTTLKTETTVKKKNEDKKK